MNNDAVSNGLPRLFHGRNIASARADIKLAKRWLSCCERNHGNLCSATVHDIPSNSKPLNASTLFIDVREFCLVPAPVDARYIVLSYCWPTKRMFVTIEANVEELKRAGSLKEVFAELPLSVQDAVHCVQELGEQYLWVDALCIVQNSGAHKMDQIFQMNKVYSYAVLTIVAAPSSTSPSMPADLCGLLGYRPGTRAARQLIKVVHNLHLSSPSEAHTNIVEHSRWNNRAWTFQEQALSKRLLYFTDVQMYFACSSGTFCEDTVSESATCIHRPWK